MTEIKAEYLAGDAGREEIIEIAPAAVVLSSTGSVLREKKQDGYIKLWVGFRNRLLKMLRGSNLSVFLCISLHMNEDYACYPSIETIASETGYRGRQVIRSIKALENMGLLTVHREDGRSNLYHVELAVAYCNDIITGELTSDIMSPVTPMSPVTFTTLTSDICDIEPVTPMSLKEESLRRTLRTNVGEIFHNENTPSVEEPEDFSLDCNANQETGTEGCASAAVSDDELSPEEWIEKAAKEQRGGKDMGVGGHLTEEDYKKRIQSAMAKGGPQYQGAPDLSKWPEDVRDLLYGICKLWGLEPPGSRAGLCVPVDAFWLKSSRALIDACGEFGYKRIVPMIKDAYEEKLVNNGGRPPYTISGPQSLINVARATAGEIRSRNGA